MSTFSKILNRIVWDASNANIGFDELCFVLRRLGFQERIRGSHHIFTREDIPEILNLQPRGSQAKPYQVKQVRGVIVSYGLGGLTVMEESEEAPDQRDPRDPNVEEQPNGE